MEHCSPSCQHGGCQDNDKRDQLGCGGGTEACQKQTKRCLVHEGVEGWLSWMANILEIVRGRQIRIKGRFLFVQLFILKILKSAEQLKEEYHAPLYSLP